MERDAAGAASENKAKVGMNVEGENLGGCVTNWTDRGHIAPQHKEYVVIKCEGHTETVEARYAFAFLAERLCRDLQEVAAYFGQKDASYRVELRTRQKATK